MPKDDFNLENLCEHHEMLEPSHGEKFTWEDFLPDNLCENYKVPDMVDESLVKIREAIEDQKKVPSPTRIVEIPNMVEKAIPVEIEKPKIIYQENNPKNFQKYLRGKISGFK